MGEDKDNEPEEPNEPNEFGFAGAATGPEPNLSEEKESEGEEIAVPAGDITGAIVSAIEGDRGEPQQTDRTDETGETHETGKTGEDER